MLQNDEKWNEFLKNGSVLAYLSYVASISNRQEGEQSNENSNARPDYQGNEYW